MAVTKHENFDVAKQTFGDNMVDSCMFYGFLIMCH